MRILLICSAFNGLTQRAWSELRAAGHQVQMHVAVNAEAMRWTVAAFDPDLVLCPFLKDRIPPEVWRNRPTVIIHPGPPGDRGPSSLDWAISDAQPRWGVTALQAVEEMDAGPIWGSATFDMPVDPPRKSSLYNGPVADAAIALVHEVVAKAADPTFVPTPLDYSRPEVTGRLRPAMRRPDRAFSWDDPTATILRRIRAADGAPGVRTTLCGTEVSVFDAHRAVAPRTRTGQPGAVLARCHGAVLVRTGDGAAWIGHVRTGGRAVKLPATLALGELLGGVPEESGYREISYRRAGPVGVLSFEFYNGAMSSGQCRRLAAAVHRAAQQDTRVLVLRGGDTFSNGIHLGVIEAARHPETAAWRNIVAIDDACREIITCTDQLVVSAIGGNAGAGGVMLALGADQVLARDGVVLNPHYATMGLFGSEYWTYVLPRRVGPAPAAALTGRCEPLGAGDAVAAGLVDEVLAGSRGQFDDAVGEHAQRLATGPDYDRLLRQKRAIRDDDERRRPLEAYRTEELAEMSRDIFDDRHGFAAARRAFIDKIKAPGRLLDTSAA